MGLVLEHQQPVLDFTIHLGGHMDGTGVDFLALVQFWKKPAFFQGFRGNGGNVHQGFRTFLGLLAIDLRPQFQIMIVGLLHTGVFNLAAVNMGRKSGVTAVIGPVRIYCPDFRDRRVPAFGIPEVGLQKFQVIQIHGQPQTLQQFLKGGFIHGGKALHGVHMVRNGVGLHQRFRLFQGRFPAFHRVNQITPDFLQIFLRKGERTLSGAFKQVLDSRPDQGTFTASHQLNALGGRISPLVELSRQGFHGQGPLGAAAGNGDHLIPDDIHLRLGKDGAPGFLEGFRVQVFHVVAMQNPHAGQTLNTQKIPQVCQQAAGARDSVDPLGHD